MLALLVFLPVFLFSIVAMAYPDDALFLPRHKESSYTSNIMSVNIRGRRVVNSTFNGFKDLADKIVISFQVKPSFRVYPPTCRYWYVIERGISYL